MNIIVTGSLGNISKPLTEQLVQKGHSVTVISHSPERKATIKILGATPAIGTLEDVDFLTFAFTGTDAAYCMLPFNFEESDQPAYLKRISHNYAHAIRNADIKRVILLSGWAAGIFKTYEEIENIFNELSGVSVTHIRPGYFYSNFYDSINMIKNQDCLTANFGGGDKLVLTAPSDIADAVVDEITIPQPADKKVRYVASDEMTCSEAARILGAAIGKPYLKWVTLTDQQMQKGLESYGMSSDLAASLVEMQAVIHQGLMTKEFSLHKSETTSGKIKMSDFAKEFARIFRSN